MQLLSTKSASFWTRHMHCMLLLRPGQGVTKRTMPILSPSANQKAAALLTTSPRNIHHLIVPKTLKDVSLSCPHMRNNNVNLVKNLGELDLFSKGHIQVQQVRHKRIELSQWRRRFSQSQADHARSLPQHIQAAMTSLPMHYLNGASQDLKRFLEEVGTDPKEARYWLKQFSRESEAEPDKPFAIVQVDVDVFSNPDMLDKLGSCLSFLHRNRMKCVVVHGYNLPRTVTIDSDQLNIARQQLNNDTMLLVSILESHGAPARPLFSGSSILQAERDSDLGFRGNVSQVNADPLKWTLASGHLPVVSSIGESSSGQLINLDVWDVTGEMSKAMKPLKVMFLNTTGGLLDDNRHVIPNVNLPADLRAGHSWCRGDVKQTVERISSLLNDLPPQSSIIQTSAHTLLTELFTHHGSGTFFKNTEPIHTYSSLEQIDLDRLLHLINRSFGRKLKDGYFESIRDRLHTLYLSEEYNCAAILTKEPGLEVPYLDKFAVSLQTQGLGTSDMLWENLRRDHKGLFWRSKGVNRINPWYFKRCEGSWSNGAWIVFWYGIANHKLSSDLVDFALLHPSTFLENIRTGQDNTLVE